MVQSMAKPYPDLPDIPLALDFAKTEEDRRLLEAGAQNPQALSFPFVLPPGTPKDRVGILRTAFEASMRDKQLLAEAEKAKRAIAPASGTELEETIAQIFKTDPAVIARLQKIAYEKD